MKKILSLLLAVMMLATMCWTGVWAVSAQDASATVLNPVYSAQDVSVSTTPVGVTEDAVSDFTADIDYTVKEDKTASVTFDMEDAKWKNVYFNDFNNGEVWTSSAANNNMSNTGSALKFVGKAWFAADPIVENVGDFEFEFDVVGVNHSWTNANFYMRDDQYVMYICGNSAAPTIDGEKAYLYFQNRSTGEKLGYNGTVAGKTVRVVSVGKTVQIYVNDVLAIDYVCGYDWFKPATGSIYATVTECAITYDNVSVNVPHDGTHNPETESYYEVGLGQNVTLGRRVNGVYTEIAKSDVTLTADKQYNFKVMRKAGSVTVTADGDEVLSTTIDFPYTEGDVSLWNGTIGLTASGDNIIERVDVYDSTNINITNEYTEILAYDDAVADKFTPTNQGSWNYSGDNFNANATYSITSDNEFSLVSPTQTNSWAFYYDLLNESHSDVYITFDIRSSRDNSTEEKIYFAGYTISFPAGAVPSVTSPSGMKPTVNDTYKYFGMAYYTVELLRKGSTVSVYYYPQHGERTLLFTDDGAASAKTNFGVYKRQGTTTFKNFYVYDAVPTGKVYFPYLNAHSLYVKTADGVGAIPMGTTVREVKANFNYGSSLTVSRDGVQLADTDTVLSGDTIGSTQLSNLSWNIGTLGDLNGDGKLTAEDVDLISTAYGVPAEQTAALAGADVNQDGTIDEADATSLSSMIASGMTTVMYAKRSLVGDAILANCKAVGRQYYVENTGVNFEWNAANITLGGYMKGDVTVTINMDIGDALDEAAIIVIIDGDTENEQFIHLQKGVATYTVASGLTEGYHTVKIMKNSETIMSLFYMEAINFTGTPTKVADKARKIEFLGDSITAGCGVLLTTDSDWYHYVNESYAAVVADIFDADWYAMANSGWSFADYHKYTATINSIYEYDSYRRSPCPTHDFSTWQPDVIVINLGTNDNTAITKTLTDASMNHEANYKEAVKIMLDKVRKNNPDANIIWTYGAMTFGTVLDESTGKQTGDWIKEAVELYSQTDSKVSFYKMPLCQNGGGGHPDKIGSVYLGEDFAEYISDIMDWGYSVPESETYNYGDSVASYAFDGGTTEGIYATKDSLISVNGNALQLTSDGNLCALSSAFAQNRNLDAYEMTLEWAHSGANVWSRQMLTLRSPNSSLTDAIYLTFLGANLTGATNFYNPLKKEGMNIQFIASKNGVKTELGSLNISDLYSGTKMINVKMNAEYLEVTIWTKGTDMPATPTFAVEINEDIAPTSGDIFFQNRNSTDKLDNIDILYGVTVDVPGDLDNTLELEAADTVLMRKYLLGFKDGINRFATDTNTDKVTDIRDLIRLKKLMADWEPTTDTAVILDPIYSSDSVTLNTSPIAVTDTMISDFTANTTYTVKADQTASVTFDMDDAVWSNVYFNDFNNGEVWSSSASNNNMSNTGSALKFVGKGWFEADPIVDNVGDFELEFDVVNVTHDYTNANFYMHNSQYVLFICGAKASTDLGDGTRAYMYFQNRTTGERINYASTSNLTGKNVRVVAIGKTVKVYVNDELVIDYVPTKSFTLQTGSIFATVTECAIILDNVSVNVPRNGVYDPEKDSYYEVKLGEKVSLGRRINGVYTEIASSSTTLVAGKTYDFNIIRSAGTVTVTANRKTVLTAEIDFPYTEGDVTLYKGLIGVAASAEDTFADFAVYDSENIKIYNDYTEIFSYEDAVKDEFAILSQGAWGQTAETFNANASYNITSDSEFKFVSPSQTNGWVNFDNILKQDHADVYIKFDMDGSRDNYTADTIVFAGYTIVFEAGKTAVVTAPSGTKPTVNTTYGYMGANYYTIELLKKGSTVTAYYYPAGTARTLLFTDDGATAATTNLRFSKRQGTISVKNFIVYDAIPTGVKSTFNLSQQSAYMKTADGVGLIPMGTTVREVKANLVNGHTVEVMRGEEVLSATDTVLTGDVIQSTQLATARWTIGTLADLNGDGKITSDDVTLAKTATSTTNMNSAALTGADMDQNGIINAADIETLESVVAGSADMTYIKRSIVGDALLEQFKTVGRQYYQQNKGVNFEWSSASITIAGYMKGDVKITLDYDSGVEGIDDGFIIYVDGDKSTDNYTSLISGVNTYTVATDLAEGYHTVEILKNNSSAEDAFYMMSVDMTGKTEKVAPAARKIEFLGDSITAGSGVLPSDVEGSGGAHYQHYTYAAVASRALGADFYAMANSGWGFANHLKYPYTIERIYELATDRRDPEFAHDFSTWQPDLVVVNLGTNDNTVVNNQYNAAVKAGTEFDFATAKSKYQASVVTLLDKIRKNNPNAKIIWTYGAMGYGLTDPDGNTTGDWIKDAVAGWNETNGNATFYRMPSSQNGGGGHPESIGSKYLGEGFAEFIAEFMEWEYTPEVPDTYEQGEVIKDYTFDDGTTEGIYTNNLSYATNNNGRLQLNSDGNLNLNSNGIVGNKYLDTYEMSLEWTHSGATQWNREIIVLRSPNSSTGTAIYLCTLGSSLATIDNYFNPLKNTTDNVQLVAVNNGTITKLGSASISNIFSGTNKINVKMGTDSIEVTIWKSGEEMPTTPTFSAEINEEIAPTHGDIFFESRNSNNFYDNINIVYGVNN